MASRLSHAQTMDFRDFAAKETTALIERLLASQSDVALQQIRVLRDALDEAARVAEAGAAATPHLTDEVHELVKRLNNAASTAVRSVSQRIRDEAQATLEAVHGELDAQRSETERLAVALAGAEAQVEVLRDEVRHERERAESLEHDLTAARDAHDQLERDGRDRLETARLEFDTALRQQTEARSAVEDELREARGLLDASLFEAARVAEQLEAETTEKLNLQRDLAAAQAEHDRIDAARLEAEAAYQQELDARAALESDVRETRELLDAALAQSARLANQLETEVADTSALRSDLASARVTNAELEAARSSTDDRIRELTQAHTALESELQDVRLTLDAALAETAALNAQVDSSAAEQNRLLAELSVVQGELDTAQTQRDAVASQMKTSAARAHTLERNQTKLEETIQKLEARLSAADNARRVHTAEGDGATAGLRAEVDRLVELLSASARGVDELAEAGSLTELFGALVRQLASQFSRVALFRLKGNRLEGEHQSGFDPTTDVTKLVIPLGVDSLLTRAATSGVVESLSDSDRADGGVALFGSDPAAALALPIVLHGEPLAIAYVEHAVAPAHGLSLGTDGASAAYARLLVSHAVALLARLTKELKTLAELREYATILLQEAEQMFVADSDAGKDGDELRSRLKDNIECARQLYAQRAALEGAAASSLLDEQIASMIDAQNVTPFAQELAALVGHSTERRAAEAS